MDRFKSFSIFFLLEWRQSFFKVNVYLSVCIRFYPSGDTSGEADNYGVGF